MEPILKSENQKELEKQKKTFSVASIINIYNQKVTKSGLSPFHLTPGNKERVKRDLKKLGLPLENFAKYVNKIITTPYLIGKNDKKWKASFEWIIKKDNYIHIMQGRYDSKKKDKKKLPKGVEEEIIEAMKKHGKSGWENLGDFLSNESFQVVNGHWCKLFHMSEYEIKKYLKGLQK